MDERKDLPPEEPREPYVPASPLKRIWAWVGVVYMVIIVLLMTYMYGTGTYLHGIASLISASASATFCPFSVRNRLFLLWHL